MPQSSSAHNWIPLWPIDAPGGQVPPKGTEKNFDGRINQTERPEYQLHLADKPNGQGVALFPGGGYCFVSVKNEGLPVAKWLNERGISVIIVKYRVDEEMKYGYKYPIPLLDARRAIRTLRYNADSWNLNKNEIGVIGFSAGGHLAAMTSSLSEEHFEELESQDRIDCESVRPNFSILGYPVIDMSNDFRHDGSTEHLSYNEAQLMKFCSLQNQVTHKTPATFAFHSSDDSVVPLKNSLKYAQACSDNKVPITLHVFVEGGHGYGMEGDGDFSEWPQFLERWLLRKPWTKTSPD